MHKPAICFLVISCCSVGLADAGLIGRRVIIPKGSSPPIGPYSPAVLVGNILFVSGQVGIDKDGQLVPGGVEAQAKQALANIETLLKAAGTDTGNVKATVLLADIQDYSVVNKVYATHFAKPYPARAAFQVANLPMGAKVEIEVTAIVGTIVDAS